MATVGTEGYQAHGVGAPPPTPLPSGISVQELKQMTALRMAQHQADFQRQQGGHSGVGVSVGGGPSASGHASGTVPGHIGAYPPLHPSYHSLQAFTQLPPQMQQQQQQQEGGASLAVLSMNGGATMAAPDPVSAAEVVARQAVQQPPTTVAPPMANPQPPAPPTSGQQQASPHVAATPSSVPARSSSSSIPAAVGPGPSSMLHPRFSGSSDTNVPPQSASGGAQQQSTGSFPVMPHGLTVQELKEMTRMRLAREAGIVGGVGSPTPSQLGSVATAQHPPAPPPPPPRMDQGLQSQSQSLQALYQAASAAAAAQAAAAVSESTQLQLNRPDVQLVDAPPTLHLTQSGDMIRMYTMGPSGVSAAPAMGAQLDEDSAAVRRAAAAAASAATLSSSSFPPGASAGLAMEAGMAQLLAEGRVRGRATQQQHSRRDLRPLVTGEQLMYGVDDSMLPASNASMQDLPPMLAPPRMAMRGVQPTTHPMRPPLAVRSLSSDLAMPGIRRTSSQSSDLEAISRQMAEYVLLTPKSPHTSFIGGDPFASAAFMLSQDDSLRGGAAFAASPRAYLHPSFARPLRSSSSSSSSSNSRPSSSPAAVYGGMPRRPTRSLSGPGPDTRHVFHFDGVLAGPPRGEEEDNDSSDAGSRGGVLEPGGDLHWIPGAGPLSTSSYSPAPVDSSEEEEEHVGGMGGHGLMLGGMRPPVLTKAFSDGMSPTARQLREVAQELGELEEHYVMMGLAGGEGMRQQQQHQLPQCRQRSDEERLYENWLHHKLGPQMERGSSGPPHILLEGHRGP